MRVSVVGGGTVSDEERETARQVGRLLAERGHAIVCGGRGGVMAAACEGARGADPDAETIGILPGEDVSDANSHVSTPIATGLGNARNVLVAMNGAAVIAVDGGPGTLSEVGHALDFDRPVAGLGTYDVPGVEHVDAPADAVDYVESATGGA